MCLVIGKWDSLGEFLNIWGREFLRERRVWDRKVINFGGFMINGG